jgi:hypothetical protein
MTSQFSKIAWISLYRTGRQSVYLLSNRARPIRAYHCVMPPTLSGQVVWLLLLAIPIACVSRTIIFEEVFRELRDYCHERSKTCRHLMQRKVFYMLTCEYCFSHYVTLFFLVLTRFRLLIDDWRGYVLAFFALVFIANIYLNIYARLRVDIHQAKVETKVRERELDT